MLAFGFVALLFFGVLLVLVGANMAELVATLGLDMEQVGLLGATLSAGIGAGVLIAGPLVDRFPRRPMLIASLTLCAGALLSVDSSMGLPRALVHVALAGMGGGFYETLLNVVTIERYGERATRAITWIHTAATLGAVIAPPILATLASRGGFVLGFEAAGAAILLLVLWAFFVPLDSPAAVPEPEATQPLSLVHPWLLSLCGVGFAYIGAEASITLFAVAYATDALSLDPERGVNAISAFWLGIFLGRVALLLWSGKPGPRWLVGSGVAAGFFLAICVGLGVHHIEVFIGVCGLLVAGVFPVMVTLAGEYFPRSRGTAIGIAVGAGSLGGFAVPWLVGWLAFTFGIQWAIQSLSVCFIAIGLSALILLNKNRTPRHS